jgi:hypothetical protein
VFKAMISQIDSTIADKPLSVYYITTFGTQATCKLIENVIPYSLSGRYVHANSFSVGDMGKPLYNLTG